MCRVCTTKHPKLSRAVGARGQYWETGQTIRIKFLGGNAVREGQFRAAVSEWLKSANLKVRYVTSGEAECRVSFNDNWGSWSTVGAGSLYEPQSQPTTNIGWDGVDVCLHEFGHFLGLYHEHQNPTANIPWNKPYVNAYLKGAPNYWTQDEIDYNVYDAHDPATVDFTKADFESIMMYSFPPEWTLDGSSVGWNTELSEVDKSFIGSIYPFESTATEDPIKAFLQKVFTRRVEVSRMYEKNIVNMGKALGLDMDINDNKTVNAKKVSDFLGI